MNPFVWPDVAAVCVASALPLAWALAAWVGRRSRLIAALAAVAAVGVWLVPAPGSSAVARALTGLALALPPALAVAAWCGKSAWPVDRLAACAAVAILAVVPATYTAARCQREDARLGELLSQSRFGEADALARSLLALDPGREWEGRPLSILAERLRRGVRDMEASVAAPLPADASPRVRLDRARRLAMLGRTAEALEVLGDGDAESLTLRATILETREEWSAALDTYQRAETTWASAAEPARTAGMAQATAGVAYCQRKLGNYGDAEAAYLRMLALSPTADSHFLVAQFYEDTQQADKARTHARKAMALAPSRYRERGEKLIRKLAVYHFGCLESRRP